MHSAADLLYRGGDADLLDRGLRYTGRCGCPGRVGVLMGMVRFLLLVTWAAGGGGEGWYTLVTTYTFSSGLYLKNAVLPGDR